MCVFWFLEPFREGQEVGDTDYWCTFFGSLGVTPKALSNTPVMVRLDPTIQKLWVRWSNIK